MYMCMQVHDSGQCQCKQDQHYTQAVPPSCNHPNDDGWPVLSTGRCDAERVRLKAVPARIVYSYVYIIFATPTGCVHV